MRPRHSRRTGSAKATPDAISSISANNGLSVLIYVTSPNRWVSIQCLFQALAQRLEAGDDLVWRRRQFGKIVGAALEGGHLHGQQGGEEAADMGQGEPGALIGRAHA